MVLNVDENIKVSISRIYFNCIRNIGYAENIVSESKKLFQI